MCLGLLLCLPLAIAAPAAGTAPGFQRIDAHAHVAPPPQDFLQLLDRANVRLLNVTLIDPLAPPFDKPEPQNTWAAGIARQSDGRIAWASTFDPGGFENPGFAPQAARDLRGTFENGAVAVKIYKSIGMHLRSAAGTYVLPDHPSFAPVLDSIAVADRTLLAHLAEPRTSWQPLDPQDPHYAYFKANPAWHMYQHPDRPSWQDIIDARDRMLQRHPNLRVIGCHLGSMEHDVAEIARRLDRYPNFAVDTAARVPNLMLQPRDKVRAFLIRYQDRILWGTDLMELKWDDPAGTIARWEAAWQRDWQYFASDQLIQAGGRTIQGLALPEPVLRKIFRENALRWIPGAASAFQPGVTSSAAAPTVDEILRKYVTALGGEAALSKITTRGAAGVVEVATYGGYGRYQEFAKAPDSFLRTFTFENLGPIQTSCNDGACWEESLDSGIVPLTGVRLEQTRRQATFFPATNLRALYSELTVTGRRQLDDWQAFEVKATAEGGVDDRYWFDPATGLLLGAELLETFSNGVSQRVRMLYEDYRSVDGAQVPHRIRYESPRLIWIIHRQVLHSVSIDPSVFNRPDASN